MSFGFSVGDILGGASLALRLYKALSETKGSARDYQQLIAELNVVHKVLLQVEQLRVSNSLAQATLNAVLFTTNSANEAMEEFLTENEKYREALGGAGSHHVLRSSWRKWQWNSQMETERNKLSQTLANMLVSINCLVQLACFFNTDYNPGVNYEWKTDHLSNTYEFSAPFENVKSEAGMPGTDFMDEKTTNFSEQNQPAQFFRAGQVFSVRIAATFYMSQRSRWKHRRVEISQLPLEPLGTLKAKREQAQKEDREARLEQILSLPLAKMIQYTKEGTNRKVVCAICLSFSSPAPGWESYKSFSRCRFGTCTKELARDVWPDEHFRRYHWREYCPMRGISPSDGYFPSIASYIKPNTKQPVTQPSSADSSDAPPPDWITLEDLTSDDPIYEDEEFKSAALDSVESGFTGPITIRRFVVVKEGLHSCLCVGVHTYAGLGSSDQPDQNLFAILHSSKEVPPPLEKEIGMVLNPIRMKPEHPSTALPNSARIHFGRTYKISHYLPVKPLGLIHTGSMESLISQSVAHVYRHDPEKIAQLLESQRREGQSGEFRRREFRRLIIERGEGQKREVNGEEFEGDLPKDVQMADDDIIPADIEVVKDMRNSIMNALGPDISIGSHPPRKLSPLPDGMNYGAHSGLNKRMRIS